MIWDHFLAKDFNEDEFEAMLAENARVTAEFDEAEFKPDQFESTQQDLSDRAALRRVAGLSTELTDISEAEYRQLRLERVILVGVWTEGTVVDAENSMAELKALAETAGSTVLEALIQRRDKPDSATFIGSGKVQELKAVVNSSGADLSLIHI
jgi:GTP-binding protein HflX